MMNDWKVVQSKSDKHPEFGYPMGQVLCRNINEAEDLVNNSEFTDCYIEDCILDKHHEIKAILPDLIRDLKKEEDRNA